MSKKHVWTAVGLVTLALAMAATAYLLNPSFFDWVPTARMSERPAVFGIFEIDSARSFYYLCVIVGIVDKVHVDSVSVYSRED